MDPNDYAVKRAGDHQPLVRNPGKATTANARQKEYMRALAAVKINKMFSKPFVASLDGHTDSVEVIARSRTLLGPVFSGGADGCLNFWDLPHRRSIRSVQNAHDGFIRGLVLSNDNRIVYTCGVDKTIKLWRFDPDTMLDEEDAMDDDTSNLLVKSIDWSSGFNSIDHHWDKPSTIVTTCAHTVDVWDLFSSNSPVQSFQWGDEGILSAKFNPSETNLLAVTMKDNGIGLFDTRLGSGIQKVYLKNKSNAVCWNPRDPFVFAVANDDGNVYQMDMRRIGGKTDPKTGKNVVASPIIRMHTGHVQGVCDVDFNPRGTELATGGYDKTVRIFELNKQKSREIYHTQRMQRVLTVKYSADGRFILSGSEDTNMRLWKAVANEKLGLVDGREKRAMEYRNALVERFKTTEEIGKIHHHRHIPKWIKNEGKRRSDKFEARKIAQSNTEIVGKQDEQKRARNHPLAKPVVRQEL
jgi:DDB1- and CUL4-associated factor 13